MMVSEGTIATTPVRDDACQTTSGDGATFLDSPRLSLASEHELIASDTHSLARYLDASSKALAATESFLSRIQRNPVVSNRSLSGFGKYLRPQGSTTQRSGSHPDTTVSATSTPSRASSSSD
jgi:hypothetical protein